MTASVSAATVVSVNLDRGHHFSKNVVPEVVLVEGLGIEGDAHAGATVQHLSRKRWHKDEPNLRQVHLIHRELFDELAEEGYSVEAGNLGENVTTEGIDLLGLPRGTVLHLGDEAAVEITGLRNPCIQIDRFQQGLLKAVVRTDDDGSVERRTGVMSVVVAGGTVRAGDSVRVELPAEPHEPLRTV
ncbi:MOSC domain-containing protein YiiM [Labedella gwakjiensis]|uniref:MOSC domain-containing protein n=1 Tax=Labedella gwakjiensis TaxID=390269 RepID=A0A2P8GZ45_9MICO|nr:MOSC domain-containing protein [Labedella gwakjiensis]PSL39236.1 MOSC domain-containing protein YiiM [Labedella gwakjiensis]RUQ86339.1 MOSC domain-containing protein [Labedella gwakjiensis]